MPDLTVKPIAKDIDMLLSLEARIDQELGKKSFNSKRSDSPRWMKEETKRVKNSSAVKFGTQKTSFAQSRETSRRDTINTQMEVPDEGIIDMKDYTDIDLNSSNLLQKNGPKESSNVKNQPKSKVIPKTYAKTPGQIVQTSKTRQTSRNPSVTSKVPTYGMKSNLAANV